MKFYITNNKKTQIDFFYRFLKENNAFEKFCKNVKKSRLVPHGYNFFYDFVYDYNINMKNFILDCVSFFREKKEEIYWINIHEKWIIYIYENNFYGKPYTCSKKDLINKIIDIHYYSIDDDLRLKTKDILLKENMKKHIIYGL